MKKVRNLKWLIEPGRILLYWDAADILSICPAVSFIAFYDQPLVTESGLGITDKVKYAFTPDRKV